MTSQRGAPRTVFSLSASQPVQQAVAVGIALLAVIVRGLISWRTHFTGEDALITLRYADNIAAGRGFVYNISEHVLGVTTPLYALLLSVFSSLHLNAMLYGKACNILAEGVTCYLLARLLARPEIGRPVEGLFAASIYALTSTPISVGISGMETGLVTCLGVAMIYAYVSRRTYWLYTLGAVLFLLRIDGLVLFGILAVALAIRDRKLPDRAGAIALIIALPWVIFAVAYFGTPIPTSVIAKVIVYNHPSFAVASGHITPGNREAFEAQFTLGWVQRGLTLLFGLGTALVLWQAICRAPRGVLAAPIIWCLFYYAVMLFSRVPAFPWYFLPPWPVFIAAACIAAATAPIKLGKMQPELAAKWSGRAVPAALAVLILLGIAHLSTVVREVSVSQQLEDEVRKPVGLWLKSHMSPGERVMLEPIGYIGYYSRQRVLDVIGLVSPEVLISYRNKEVSDPKADIINRLRPEWLCLRASEEAALLASHDVSLNAMYLLEARFGSHASDAFAIYRIRKDMPARKAH